MRKKGIIVREWVKTLVFTRFFFGTKYHGKIWYGLNGGERMFFTENNDITMTKGDSGQINLKFKNKDGSEYVPTEADEVVFSVKRRKEGFAQIVLEKRGCELVFEAAETEKIPSGEYVYDVFIKRNTGERYTAIEGKFILRKAVHEFE